MMETDAVFLCRKVERQTGRIMVYKLDVPFSGYMALCLKIRQQFNPESRYFCAGANFYAESETKIFAMLKNAMFRGKGLKRWAPSLNWEDKEVKTWGNHGENRSRSISRNL